MDMQADAQHVLPLPELPFSSLSLALVDSGTGCDALWGLREVRTGEDQHSSTALRQTGT